MNCHDYPGGSEALASLFAAAALTAEESRAFEAHLNSGCAACNAAVRSLGTVTARLFAAVTPQEPPPSIRATLLSRIAAAQPGILVQREADAVWHETPIPGVRIRILFLDRANNRCTILGRMEPGRTVPHHCHSFPEESLVLEGDLRCGDRILRAGDYQRAEAGSMHETQTTEGGCLILVSGAASDILPG